ncbi:MAG: GNAT family N-acetyltransferase [Candidatus Thiodiazotropha sp. (ex Dulcina madagascariensis)]|nr:GNAT family N-acetyltransferase [Candidatus Thiodiazotropha sp. (ex Dulcina madagascariensis)]MCU7928774.1 GNAT family N-acetyltransferase [Candidatus Thiodiazotropha sp. (ex Dulcina madagascariensis)]
MQTPPLHLPDGLGIRPARDSDRPFIESLYNTTRNDLRLIDAEADFIESLIEQQQQAQTVGYGDQFPNAMYFIIEKQGERIGRIVIDFGPNEIRIIDVALIPMARGKGYGTGIIRALKHAAGSACSPLVLSVYKSNPAARQLYEQEGFRVEQSDQMIDQMAWYPIYS